MSGKLRFYKEKLEGYKKFYQIVSTIKRVALSKYQSGVLRVKTRDATLRYTRKAFDMPNLPEEEELIKSAQGKTVYIPICTNRGNCGPLNSANYRYITELVDVNGGKDIHLIVVGKKGHDSIPKLFPDQYYVTCMNHDKQAKSMVWASFIGDHVDTIEGYERIQVIFNRFVSAGSQKQVVYNIPSFQKFLDHMMETAQAPEPTEASTLNNYRFANALLDKDETDVKDFYEFHRSLALLNAAAENELSEHAARIIAVEGQLTNIAQLRDAAMMIFNKTRQGAITTALIEILSAMTAMGDAAKGSGIKKTRFWETAKSA